MGHSLSRAALGSLEHQERGGEGSNPGGAQHGTSRAQHTEAGGISEHQRPGTSGERQEQPQQQGNGQAHQHQGAGGGPGAGEQQKEGGDVEKAEEERTGQGPQPMEIPIDL